MKHLIAISMTAVLACATALPSAAQSSPPQLPTLTQRQSQDLADRMDAYRRYTDERVARGEITPDEASRLLSWREWQLARQIASSSPATDAQSDVPPDYIPPAGSEAASPRDVYTAPPRDVYVAPAPAPVYRYYYPAPYYPAPYYWGPRPYAYWGPSICAGGFGRHFGGRVCF